MVCPLVVLALGIIFPFRGKHWFLSIFFLQGLKYPWPSDQREAWHRGSLKSWHILSCCRYQDRMESLWWSNTVGWHIHYTTPIFLLVVVYRVTYAMIYNTIFSSSARDIKKLFRLPPLLHRRLMHPLKKPNEANREIVGFHIKLSIFSVAINYPPPLLLGYSSYPKWCLKRVIFYYTKKQ